MSLYVFYRPITLGGGGGGGGVASLNGESGVVTLVGGTGITVTPVGQNITITNTGVTSVGLAAPSIFTVSGSPVTSSGTLTLSYSGVALPILNGGTGQTTAITALNALLPVPYEIIANYTSNHFGLGMFSGNISDQDQVRKLVMYGSTDTAIGTNTPSTAVLVAGDNTSSSITGSGKAGTVRIQAGSITADTTHNIAGGRVYIAAGSSKVGAAGDVYIDGGVADTGSGGGIVMTAGATNGVANGGSVLITSGFSANGPAGGVFIDGGFSIASAGGSVQMVAGDSALVYGGDISIGAGGSGVGAGGSVYISSGFGDTAGTIVFNTGNTAGNFDADGNLILNYGLFFRGSTSGFFRQFVRPTITDYSVIWPAAQGTGALTNDGAGNLSWNASALSSVSVATANGFSGTSSGGTNPALTLTTTITGILQGNGTAISAATTTGSGSVVLATSPTLVTPNLGTPSALVGTNITGTATGLTVGTATTATNLAGGLGGSIPYQSAASTTAMLANGTAGQVLTSAGTTLAPTWTTPAVASGTVTSVSVVAANNVTGSVATSTTTPAITLSPTSATPAASSFASWDANKNLSSNNSLTGYQTIVTAVGTTTLTVASTETTLFTGTSTQTVVMPVVNTLVLGQSYTLINTSTSAVLVQSSGGNTIISIQPFARTTLTYIAAGTSASSWSFSGAASLAGATLNSGIVVSNLGTVGTITTGVWNGTTIDILHGGTGVTAVNTSPVATAWAGWNSDKNMSSNNTISAVTTTVTAGSHSIASGGTGVQVYTGSTASTITLPVVSGMLNGTSFKIINESSAILTVNTSGGNLVKAMAANTMLTVTVINNVGGTGTASWAWVYDVLNGGIPIANVAPTIQKFTSSTGTYTTPTSPSPLYIRVRMVGGGGGGGGGGLTSTTATNGTNGNATTFGTTLMVANGGAAGQFANNPGVGGTASLGSGPFGTNLQGGMGGTAAGGAAGGFISGGTGASTPFGGAGAGGVNVAGFNAIANTGAGGGGGGTANAATVYSGSGGSAGGFVDAVISPPVSTYAYVVGASAAGGAAGTSGFAGGTGASGYIEVTEYYQ